MQNAQSVVFGGGPGSRGALRGRDGRDCWTRLADGAPVLPVWRGKPLIAGARAKGRSRSRSATMAHPVLAEADEAPVFCSASTKDGGPVFAADVSGWVPDDVDEAQVGAFIDRSVQTHPSEAGAARVRRVAGDHGGADAARRGACGHGARGAAMARHASPLRPLRRRKRPVQAGWQRRCETCGAGHFPRTDPVVIMLITDGDRVLVGRSPGWPERMYSLLAGFVEPGETVEDAVRREVLEESGIRVGRALPRQPALAVSRVPDAGLPRHRGDDEITVDPEELDDARWVGRSEMLEVFMGRHPEIAGRGRGPSRISCCRRGSPTGLTRRPLCRHETTGRSPRRVNGGAGVKFKVSDDVEAPIDWVWEGFTDFAAIEADIRARDAELSRVGDWKEAALGVAWRGSVPVRGKVGRSRRASRASSRRSNFGRKPDRRHGLHLRGDLRAAVGRWSRGCR
jgi:NAD+ diphosphatase